MITRIYVLCEPDGKIRYVGKTVKSLQGRLSGHLYDARNMMMDRRCNWIRYILKKGFLPDIRLVGEVGGDGCKEEIAWIKYFRDEELDLVNGTDGGEGVSGHKHSEKTRSQISSALKGHKPSEETRHKLSLSLLGNKRGLGYKHTLEEKEKKRKSLCDRWKTQKEKMISFLTGHECSEETKQKISMAHKGKKMSDDARRNMSLGQMGNKNSSGHICTEEMKAKIRLFHTGLKHSAKTRLKMSTDHKQRSKEN